MISGTSTLAVINGWRKGLTTVAALAVFCAVAPRANAGQVFFADFETPGTPAGMSGGGSRVQTSTFNPNVFTSEIGSGLWRNSTNGNPATATVLTLGSLDPNAPLVLTLDFVAIGSWDGSSGCCNPDIFDIFLNGVTQYSNAFKNFGTSTPQMSAATGAAAATTTVTSLGFGPVGNSNGFPDGSGFGNSTWHIVMTGINADNAGQAVFEFRARGAGWQGGSDESIGLDNMSVDADAPEPASLLMVLGGLTALACHRRARRRLTA